MRTFTFWFINRVETYRTNLVLVFFSRAPSYTSAFSEIHPKLPPSQNRALRAYRAARTQINQPKAKFLFSSIFMKIAPSDNKSLRFCKEAIMIICVRVRARESTRVTVTQIVHIHLFHSPFSLSLSLSLFQSPPCLTH